jgi:hypothetical protein
VENFVTRSKYVSETISIVVDFSDVLPAGQTIQGTPVVSIVLDTGFDPTPASILYLGVSVYNGTVVEQRFRLGVPGVIYTITWQVLSTSNLTFEKTTYLAILPNVGTVTPDFRPIYETTYLYPYNLLDSLINYLLPESAYAFGVPIEKLTSLLAPTQGSLFGGTVYYTDPPDKFNSTMSPTLGSLFGGQVTYSFAEKLVSEFAPVLGSLYGSSLSYTIPAEGLNTFMAPASGTLS